MIKYTLYEYLHGVGLMILLLVFGLILLVLGFGLSVEETLTGQKVTFWGIDISDINRRPGMELFADAEPALIFQAAFVLHATFLFGPMFFIIIGSRIIESMLMQGNRHLLLSKPMHRWHIFLARLTGFMLFSAFVVYLFLGGLWLIIGAKTGCFVYQPFAAAPMILLIYLSLISVVALVSVLVENFFAAAGITVVFYFATTVIGMPRVEEALRDNTTLYAGWTLVHGALPRIAELSRAVQELYIPGEPVEWFGPVWMTLVFCAVVIAATAFIFTRKDY